MAVLKVLFVVALLSISSCILVTKDTMPHTSSKEHKIVCIENVRCLPDAEFKDLVVERVYSAKWLKRYGTPLWVKYETVERIHRTYINRAWIFYKK